MRGAAVSERTSYHCDGASGWGAVCSSKRQWRRHKESHEEPHAAPPPFLLSPLFTLALWPMDMITHCLDGSRMRARMYAIAWNLWPPMAAAPRLPHGSSGHYLSSPSRCARCAGCAGCTAMARAAQALRPNGPNRPEWPKGGENRMGAVRAPPLLSPYSRPGGPRAAPGQGGGVLSVHRVRVTRHIVWGIMHGMPSRRMALPWRCEGCERRVLPATRLG